MYSRDCKTTFSPRATTFFAIVNSVGNNASKLSISQIFELIYLWSIEELRCRTIILTNLTEKTVTFWFSSLGKICSRIFQRREKLGGENRIIEIDESLMRGKRKFNKGRFLQMDRWRSAPNETYIPSDYDDDVSESHSIRER